MYPYMVTPQEVKKLVRNTPEEAKKNLQKLARRRKLWYALSILALAGAGYGVVKYYGKLVGLKSQGITPTLYKELEETGKMLGVKKIAFNETTLKEVHHVGDLLRDSVDKGTITKGNATLAFGSYMGYKGTPRPLEYPLKKQFESTLKDIVPKKTESCTFTQETYAYFQELQKLLLKEVKSKGLTSSKALYVFWKMLDRASPPENLKIGMKNKFALNADRAGGYLGIDISTFLGASRKTDLAKKYGFYTPVPKGSCSADAHALIPFKSLRTLVKNLKK